MHHVFLPLRCKEVHVESVHVQFLKFPIFFFFFFFGVVKDKFTKVGFEVFQR